MHSADKEKIEGLSLTSDIIVGFPTETDQDFNDTLELVDSVGFSDIHPFPFSPRSGTVAFKMNDLPKQVKKDRQAVLLAKKQECKSKFLTKFIGKELEFLCEEYKDGYAEGYSGNYLRLYVKDYVGDKKLVKVRVEAPFKDGALAKLVEN